MNRKITVGTRLTHSQIKQLHLMASSVNVSLSCCLRAILMIVRVLDEKGDTLFNMETSANSVKIAENKLSYGALYKWLIYDTNSQSSSWTTFTIPEEGKVKSIREAVRQYESRANDLPQRLSFVFYLLENDLREAAEKEIGKLKSELPENDYIKKLPGL